METASLFIQKVGVALPGITSHVIGSSLRRAPQAKGRGEDITVKAA